MQIVLGFPRLSNSRVAPFELVKRGNLSVRVFPECVLRVVDLLLKALELVLGIVKGRLLLQEAYVVAIRIR